MTETRLARVCREARANNPEVYGKIVARRAVMAEQGTRRHLDVFELCREISELDLRVTKFMPQGISGAILRKIDGRYAIYVNARKSRLEEYFIAAHELAHFLLHKEKLDADGRITDRVLFNSGLPHEDELDANRLALWILFPSVASAAAD